MAHGAWLFVAIPLVSVVSAVFAEPALTTEPGDLRLCNDDLGIILWGPDDSPTLSIGKSDIWDRREVKSERPILTLAQMMDMARAGDPELINGKAWYVGYNSYDFPCPKPAGQLILLLPFLKPDGTLVVDRGPRAIQLTAKRGDKSLQLRIFVSAVRNVVVLTGDAKGLAADDMAVRVFRHQDSIVPGGELHPTIGGNHSPTDFEQLPVPRAGQSGDTIYVDQDYLSDRTFPDGFHSVLAVRPVGATARYTIQGGERELGTKLRTPQEGRLSHAVTKRFTPINEALGSAATATLGAVNGAFTLFATVTTTQDGPDPIAKAQDALDEAVSLGTDALWAEHCKQLDAYDANPHARVWSDDGRTKIDAVWGGVPYRVRPDGFYGDVALCSVDSTKFCYQDSSMWHADFHFNEIDAVTPCMYRQFDLMDSYFKMIGALLPMAQANARQVYGMTGAVYPLVHYPLKADSVVHTHITWEQSMEITAMLAKPFWLRFQYTWDKDFLRDRAYPVLREGARFYAEFLKLGDDGLYHVFPTVSPEHRGITKNLEFNRDSQSGITLIRYHLRAAAIAAEMLGLDAAEASRWRAMAEAMPPYPTVDTPAGRVFIDVEGAQPIEYNIAVPLSSVFWGDDIGLDSPPEQVALAKRTLETINVWEPHRGYLKRVRARLGIPEPDGTIMLESVLQSHTGRIRVFPAVTPDFEGGFENLGAQGAFVVSARRSKGVVENVVITSMAGNPCVLANPWRDAGVSVIARDPKTGSAPTPVAVTKDAGAIRFDTQPGVTYRVTP